MIKESEQPTDKRIKSTITTTSLSTNQEKLLKLATEPTPVTVSTTAQIPQTEASTATTPIQTTATSIETTTTPFRTTSTTLIQTTTTAPRPNQETATQPESSQSTTTSRSEQSTKQISIQDIPQQEDTSINSTMKKEETRVVEGQTESWKKEHAAESENLPETDYDLQETTTEGQEPSITPLQKQKKQILLRLQQLHMPDKQDVPAGQTQETPKADETTESRSEVTFSNVEMETKTVKELPEDLIREMVIYEDNEGKSTRSRAPGVDDSIDRQGRAVEGNQNTKTVGSNKESEQDQSKPDKPVKHKNNDRRSNRKRRLRNTQQR